MQPRSLSLTVLAYSAVMIGLFCQFGAAALLITGSVFAPSGEMSAMVTLVIGALFFGLTFASYFMAYGIFTRKTWSWAGGITLFVTLVVASAALSFVAGNWVSTVVPLVAAVVGIWYLNRPAVKAELLGTAVPLTAPVTAPSALDGAEPAH